jgi:hypothetical protein
MHGIDCVAQALSFGAIDQVKDYTFRLLDGTMRRPSSSEEERKYGGTGYELLKQTDSPRGAPDSMPN